jgi:hypothetical protein
MNLHDDSVLNLAVDSTELLSELLGLVDEIIKLVLKLVLEGSNLVSTLGNDLTVVGGATTVPGKELMRLLVR